MRRGAFWMPRRVTGDRSVIDRTTQREGNRLQDGLVMPSLDALLAIWPMPSFRVALGLGVQS